MTFLAFDKPETSFALHQSAIQAGTVIGALATKSLLEASPSSAANVVDRLALGRLAASGRSTDAIIGNVLGVAVGASVNHAHGAINAVDFYLDDERKTEREHIIQLVQNNDSESDALLLGYVSEAMRLRPQYTGLWRESAVNTTVDQGPGLPPLEVKKGDRLRASFRNAHLNSDDFPDPSAVNPRRSPLPFANINGTASMDAQE
ncbi:hypothetical protein CPB84DRAFT_1850044 [Gymnopilus junonius]|uniref:Uncharacterized protein n=1 Tax=Gymnopilus junonius TaxID=109634 RepID=A0A9P5TJ27_GYMJU|nr:hypothetical protein CPB84DRAFT_1850044 [Gymnopilus junonius]